METKIPISDFPIPQAVGVEQQVIADIIFLPETLIEAERLITEDVFTDKNCRDAWCALRTMRREGKNIDLASAFSVLNRDFISRSILPLSNSVGGAVTTIQHFGTLRDIYIKRKCYFAAVDVLKGSSDHLTPARDIVSKVMSLSDAIQKDCDVDSSTKHISDVINEVAASIEEAQRNKAEGKSLRVPTSFVRLDFLTYGGFNAGNLVILAARPSVGKTAIMLQMAKAAAMSGNAVSLFNLEMTNAELAQRFLYSTGDITPLQVAKGEVAWENFESASGQFASKPLYLNDAASTIDEIISTITLNSQSGKCDIAFIDYLGLINFGDSKAPLNQAIASCTKRLKQTAKRCKIPIVLLCQLNRASASEKRSPMLFDLRDSGSIEQDADIVLMLERACSSLDDNESCQDINMWVRKNRQGKAGEINVEIVANETFTVFEDKVVTPIQPQIIEPTPPMDANTDFDNFPF